MTHYAPQVYNVTDFLEDHPGGPEIMMEHAGEIQATTTKGNERRKSEVTHSGALVVSWFVGLQERTPPLSEYRG